MKSKSVLNNKCLNKTDLKAFSVEAFIRCTGNLFQIHAVR